MQECEHITQNNRLHVYCKAYLWDLIPFPLTAHSHIYYSCLDMHYSWLDMHYSWLHSYKSQAIHVWVLPTWQLCIAFFCRVILWELWDNFKPFSAEPFLPDWLPGWQRVNNSLNKAFRHAWRLFRDSVANTCFLCIKVYELIRRYQSVITNKDIHSCELVIASWTKHSWPFDDVHLQNWVCRLEMDLEVASVSLA